MGKHFAHKICELGFRFRRDSGIIHGAATSLSCLFCKSVFYRKQRAVAALFRQPIEHSQKMGKLQETRITND
jgi:hypothetical protein